MTLTEADISGTHLEEPFDKYTILQPRWCFLWHGIKVGTCWKKQKIVARYVYVQEGLICVGQLEDGKPFDMFVRVSRKALI